MKIFLLEDDSNVAESMIAALEMRGNEVKWAMTLEQAKGLLSQDAYDLAILDLNVPRQPGSLEMAKGTDLLPLPMMEAVVYTGLPDDVPADIGVPVFSKGDPFGLLDHVKELGG